MGKFNFNESDFEKVGQESEVFYATIGNVYCPYLKENIAFNVKGLKHLKFKSDRQARSRNEQYARLKLLHLAPQIIKASHTLQGVWRTKRFETMNINSRWEHILKEVIFYEFIAVMENVRAKVIIKEIQGGEKHFWSIIPYWGIDRENSKRVLHGGDPNND